MNKSSSYLVVGGLCTELDDVADPDVAGWGMRAYVPCCLFGYDEAHIK